MSSLPLIIGHRGAAKKCPENTMVSFDLAFKSVQAVEFDLWLSRDRVPFIFHDAKLERTTNGTGYAISKEWKDLQTLDAGFGFDPQQDKSFPFRGQDVKIPHFEELLEKYAGKHLSVEIKQNSVDLVHEALRLLTRYKCLENCVVGSKHHQVWETMKKFYPEIPRFFSRREIILNFLDFKRGLTPQPDPYAVASLPVQKQCGMNFKAGSFIDYLHARKIKVFFWTVNDGETILDLTRAKADAIISDDPGFASQILRKI